MAAAKKKKTKCTCLAQMDKFLKDKGVHVSVAFDLVTGADLRPLIAVEKLYPVRGVTPPLVLPSYCPWCGRRYNEATKKG